MVEHGTIVGEARLQGAHTRIEFATRGGRRNSCRGHLPCKWEASDDHRRRQTTGGCRVGRADAGISTACCSPSVSYVPVSSLCGKDESKADEFASVDRVSGKNPRSRSRSQLMASSSSTSNPDPPQNLDALSLSEPIDPWSRPLDDNDPEDHTVATNLPTPPPKDGDVDGAPAGPDEPPPLPAQTPPFASSQPKVQVNQAVLDEFDPLGNKVEQEAKEAWERSEPHPPVPPKPSPPQSDPPTQDEPAPLPPSTRSLPPPVPIPRSESVV